MITDSQEILIGHTNEGRFKCHGWRLPRCTATRRHPAYGLSPKLQIDVVDSEHRQLARRMSLSSNVDRKDVAVLAICSRVSEDGIATRYRAIL